ncbi:MAG: type IV secretion system DNA-binding domain-containing protein [Edaphobacter sp.]
MATTQWGRKESIIFPPHSPIYTYGAVFLALVLTGCFIYLRFSYGQTPLQQFYTPIYARTAAGGALNKKDKYQLLYVGDGTKAGQPAAEADVQAGTTPALAGKQIPLALSSTAAGRGLRALYRAPEQTYLDAPLHEYLKSAVFQGDRLRDIYKLPFLFGFLSLLAQLPFSIAKDIKRRKQMKYGRLLKGPVMLTPKEFNKTVQGDGIGFKTTEANEMMRIPLQAEAQHIELMGDTGAGKTSLIMQILRQIQSRGHSAIVYDPACEFIQRFYDAERGDIVLNPLDARCPYWGPSEELRRKAEAKAIAASLYQPTSDKKGEFFTETPQKIFAHLLTFGPSPEQLVAWLSNPAEIDQRVRGTEMEAMIAKGAQQQRNGVLASLGLVADSLRMLPTKTQAETTWSATEWSEKRKGWIFITSSATEREALRPLHSLWIDLLVLRLLTAPQDNQTPVWFVLDELASLQRLPQLHTAITENRKSRNPLVLGFQGKAQLEVIYGHLAEVMLSQPATKIFLKTTEPKAAEWVSNAIGKVEIERMKETHFDGSRSGKNFSLDRQVEPLVMDSEISGLENRHAFLKLGNNVARFHFEYMDVPQTTPGFVPRKVEDDELPFDPKTLAPKSQTVKEPEIDLEAERPSAPPMMNQQSVVTNEEAELEADEPTEEELATAGTDPDSPSDSGEMDSDEQAQVSFQFQE